MNAVGLMIAASGIAEQCSAGYGLWVPKRTFGGRSAVVIMGRIEGMMVWVSTEGIPANTGKSRKSLPGLPVIAIYNS
jgi:hypothetical protein